MITFSLIQAIILNRVMINYTWYVLFLRLTALPGFAEVQKKVLTL